MRDLVKELTQPREVKTTQPKCALQYDRPCCRGFGYRLKIRGPFTYAEVCDCVKGCGTCGGQVHFVNYDTARPCRVPSPVKICHLVNQSQLPARYLQAHLDDFTSISGNGENALLKVRKWLNSFHLHKSKGMIIRGSVGVGKTFLLAAIAKQLMEKGTSVRFVDFFQLLSLVRAGYAENRSEQEMIAPLLDVDVLFIDELGKGRSTDFEVAVLDQIVMGRYNQNKIIVASTNCSLKKLSPEEPAYTVDLEKVPTKEGFASNQYESLEERVGERIFSRLVETSYFLELKGNDFRRKKGRTWLAF